MAEHKKKHLSRKMKKSIRYTAAGLLLASAIGVAVIPEQVSEAGTGTPNVTITDAEMAIPKVKATDPIYTNEDGVFQFVYTDKGSGTDKVAVIVGYDSERNLAGGTLVIPDTFDAYLKYTDAMGTTGGYAAAGKSGNVLYYDTYHEEMLPTGDLDEDGNPILEPQLVLDGYLPCYASQKSDWINNKDGNPREPKEFFYSDDNEVTFKPTLDENHQRIIDATVTYISSQYVEKVDDGTGKMIWQLGTDPEMGVFSKAANITNLKTGGNLLGIGNYAFHNCASLKSVEFGDGTNTIGNHAFDNCANLVSASFPTNSAILAIGDHAFYRCHSLQEFTVPVAVQKIGDSAFEQCTELMEIDLNANGQQVLLQTLGDDVFKDCTSLQHIEFPQFYSTNQDFDLAWVKGCVSLHYIKVPNANLKLVEHNVAGEEFTYDDFKDMVIEQFYFEGPDTSEIHTISKANSFAFKYLDQEVYEKVISYNSPEEGTGQSIYQVDNNNELIYFYMDDTVLQVEIPGAIGPYKITKVGSDSFRDNHNITKITIPSSIEQIASEAFKGCHKLKDIVFTEPVNLTEIGDGAFDTQVVSSTDTCTLDNIPVLTFTGPCEAGSAPFDYAMDKTHNINRGTQPVTYITFYSGWPENLTVKYNPDTDSNELINYPSLLDLASYTNNPADRGMDNYYPFLTDDEILAANNAYNVYTNGGTMSEDMQAVLDSALNVVLPKGVESVKPGLFSGVDANGDSTGTLTNNDIQTITMNGLAEVVPHMFEGCDSLIGAYIEGDAVKIGDYAFKDCENLVDVDVNPNLSEIGQIPFIGCRKLENVDFEGSRNFVCSDAVIYSLSGDSKSDLIEVLQSRGATYGTPMLSANELAGVKSIKPEAFKDCDSITYVDLTKTKIEEIPDNCFENTTALNDVMINYGCRKIGKQAFKNSGVDYLDIPDDVKNIHLTAFEDDDDHLITFYCELDSNAADYADMFDYIVVAGKDTIYHVYFYDESGTELIDEVLVEPGQNAETHKSAPVKEGFEFKAWLPEPLNIHEDTKVYATYEKIGEKTFTVNFIDFDDKILYTQTVKQGEDAITPEAPTRKGYKFTGWRPAITNIQKDLDVYAQYEKTNSKSDSGSGSGSGDSGSGSGSGSGNQGSNPTLYTVTVVDGSGSGSYVAGTNVVVAANTPPAGKKFDKWTCDNEKVKFNSTSIAATAFAMPAENVTVVANFVEDKNAGSSSSSTQNNTSGSNNAPASPNTVVDIDKKGISNSGLAYANVAGSTDNYILKITESAVAKKEVEEALTEEYNSIDNIKYVAMDISLYDSTGKNKIENTDNLSVNVTMPIPDELVPYAGNNKAAYVVNGKLMKLKPKFTTINNVPCISFTATHFSPYTIYVDTTKLDAGTIQDSTPKTGDGIHPKWFLSFGLLGASAFTFLLKDKRKKVKKA